MTINELLTTQNSASVCRTEYSYTLDTTNNEEAGNVGPIQVNKLMLTSEEKVCYSPIDGMIYDLSYIAIFLLVVWGVIKFFRK